MVKLLVQGCSKSKNETIEPVPALDLYSGYYYKIIKKAIREGSLRPDIEICILSAEYGLIDADTLISTYDRQMTASRADEIQEEVTTALRQKIVRNNYEQVILNLGRTYERAVTRFDEMLDTETTYISGQLGERGRTLKQFLRTDESRQVVV